MASDWLPRDGQSLCEWAENLKVEFPGIASSLGFSAGEITAVLLDCNYCLFAHISSGWQRWNAFVL